MRILHTADVHLQEDDSKTVESLDIVLDKAEEEDVDLLTIGGDLFDTNEDADALRPKLRDMLTGHDFDILVIPGNHDEEAFRENTDFGGDVDPIIEEPLGEREYEDVVIRGVPFKSSMTEELYSEMKDNSEKKSVLLLHCTLESGYGSDDTGGEEDYFPISKKALSDLDYDFILAGHIHSEPRKQPLSNGVFIYPGSPCSHSTSETGERHVFLIDTEESEARSIPLPSFYYEKYSKTLRPGEADEVIDELRDWIENNPQYCSGIIELDGFIKKDENKFSEQLNEVIDGIELSNQVKNVEEVLEHQLYNRFEKRMKDSSIDDKEKVRERVIDAMSELITRREIRE